MNEATVLFQPTRFTAGTSSSRNELPQDLLPRKRRRRKHSFYNASDICRYVTIGLSPGLPHHAAHHLLSESKRGRVSFFPGTVVVNSSGVQVPIAALPNCTAFVPTCSSCTLAFQASGIERVGEQAVILFGSQAIVDGEMNWKRRIGGQMFNGRVNGQIAGHIPIMAVTSFSSHHVEVNDMFDAMLEQPFSDGRRLGAEPERIHHQDRDTVPKRYPQGKSPGSLLSTHR
ncbi:hypothetical protein GSUET_03050 [Geobacter sulfurreducens subsp. ethanolicus]|nr:hypothetical protein GSUET_03050 [Geobacter sulfurreducens subsp. ethanolicus]